MTYNFENLNREDNTYEDEAFNETQDLNLHFVYGETKTDLKLNGSVDVGFVKATLIKQMFSENEEDQITPNDIDLEFNGKKMVDFLSLCDHEGLGDNSTIQVLKK